MIGCELDNDCNVFKNTLDIWLTSYFDKLLKSSKSIASLQSNCFPKIVLAKKMAWLRACVVFLAVT